MSDSDLDEVPSSLDSQMGEEGQLGMHNFGEEGEADMMGDDDESMEYDDEEGGESEEENNNNNRHS